MLVRSMHGALRVQAGDVAGRLTLQVTVDMRG